MAEDEQFYDDGMLFTAGFALTPEVREFVSQRFGDLTDTGQLWSEVRCAGREANRWFVSRLPGSVARVGEWTGAVTREIRPAEGDRRVESSRIVHGPAEPC